MWSSRAIALVAAVGVLAGCGFRPLYGERGQSGTPADLALIKIEPIPDRIGQQLHNHLLTLLNPRGRPGAPRYSMKTLVQESSTALAVRKSAFATRANFTVTASYALSGIADGRQLTTGESSITVSYNILDSEFATLMAEKDARARAVRELSEDLRIRLAVYFGGVDGKAR